MRILDFFPRDEVGIKALTIGRYLKEGSRVLFHAMNEQAIAIIDILTQSQDAGRVSFYCSADPCGVKGVHHHGGGAVDIIVLLSEGGVLQEELTACQGLKDGVVLAPKTSRFYLQQPLFVISPQKAGTHMLLNLVRRLGFKDGMVAQPPLYGGHWYFIQHDNAHTSAREFVSESYSRAAFGNRLHSFRSSPAIFLYRNPLAVLSSEAHYYHLDGKTAFCGYLQSLSLEERLLRLVDDPWLLGSIRERIGGYLPWVDFANVIPVSFEELVGSRGGGDVSIQQECIWSLQLRLHIPGSPEDIVTDIFDEKSETYRKGQIDDFRSKLTPKVIKAFRSLPQDFMEQFGYDLDRSLSGDCFSARIKEFQQKILSYSEEEFEDRPVVVDSDFLGCHLVCYKKRYFAVNSSLPLRGRLEECADPAHSMVPASNDLSTLKRNLVRTLAGGGSSSSLPVPSVIDATENYVILESSDRYLAVNKDLWPADIYHERLGEREIRDAVVIGDDLETVRIRAEAMAGGGERPNIELVYSSRKYNIVRAGGQYVAVAMSLGPIDLFLETVGEREISPKVLVSHDLQELIERTKVEETLMDSQTGA